MHCRSKYGSKTIKLLEENVRECLQPQNGQDTKALTIKKNIDKLNQIEIKNFSSSKDIIKRMKGQPQSRRYCKELQINKRKTNSLIEKWKKT